MTNEQMKPRRFEIWAKARKLVKKIDAHHSAGGSVYVCTYTKAWKYGPKTAGMFKAFKNGAFVKRGKSWDCISSCKVVFQ